MHQRIPVVLLSVLALAASGATDASAQKGKNKDKDKNKGKSEQKADDRRDRRHDDGRHDGDRDGKMTICHVPPGNPSARHTITIGDSAWQAHSRHGDHRGACGSGSPHPSGRFDTLDTNDDGVISLREWNGDRALFDRLDRNDDGVISRDEFHRR